MRFAVLTAVLLSAFGSQAASVNPYADNLASLVDPAKLKTLSLRGANPRVQKAVYQLATAKANGADPGKVIDSALASVGMKAAAASLTKARLIRNLDIASQLGCLDAAGLADMRQGRSPTVKRGPYKGQELSVDHVVPLAVAPELVQQHASYVT